MILSTNSILIFSYILTSTVGVLFIKHGFGTVERFSIETIHLALRNLFVLVGIFLYGVSFTIWLILLSKHDLSTIFPVIIGLGYVSLMVTSALLLREPFTPQKIAASILIGVGVFIMARQM